MKQANFLYKIVTSYFEHIIKTDFCSSVKLCTVTTVTCRAHNLCSLFNFLELTNEHSIRYMYIDIYIDSIILTYGIKKKYIFCFRK